MQDRVCEAALRKILELITNEAPEGVQRDDPGFEEGDDGRPVLGVEQIDASELFVDGAYRSSVFIGGVGLPDPVGLFEGFVEDGLQLLEPVEITLAAFGVRVIDYDGDGCVAAVDVHFEADGFVPGFIV